MTTVGEVFVAIRGEGSKFSGDADRIIDGGVAPAAKRVATMIGGLFVGKAAIGFAKAGIAELEDVERVGAQTEAQLKATGGAAGVTAEHLDELAASGLALTGVDDELIKSAGNVLLQFSGIKAEGGIFDRTLHDAEDVAQSMGIDVPAAAKILGRSLQDPEHAARMLRGANVLLTASQKDQITAFMAAGDAASAQGVVLSQVEAQVGGAAEAFGQTLPGQMKIAQEEMKNAKAELVVGMAPALSLVAGATTKFAEVLTSLPGPLRDVVALTLGGGAAYLALARPINSAIELSRTLGIFKAAEATATTVAADAEVAAAAETVAAQGAVTAAVTEREVVVDAAAIRWVTANEAIAFSEAEVTAAVMASEAATMQALFGQAALIAEDEALVVAEGEAAAAIAARTAATEAEAAANAASQASNAGLLSRLLGIAPVALPVVAVLGILGKSWLDTQADNAVAAQTVKDYTAALQETDGAIQDHIDKVTAQKLVDAGVTDLLSKAGIEAKSFADEVRTGGDPLYNFANGLRAGANESMILGSALRDAKASGDPFVANLATMVEQGKLSRSEAAKLADTARDLSLGLADGTKAAGDHAAALGVVKDITGQTAAATADETASLEAATKAAGDFSGFLVDLGSAMDKTYKASLSGTQATSNYEGALDSLIGTLATSSKVLYENSATLDLNSEKGRQNTDALIKSGESIATLIERRFEETHSVKDATAAGEMYVQNLRDQLAAAGYNDEQIGQMIDTINLTPEDITTMFSNNAVEQQIVVGKYLAELDNIEPEKRTEIEALIAQGAYDGANALLNELTKDRTVNVRINTQGTIAIPDLGPGATKEFHGSGLASGTENWGGGWAIVGEEGPELAFLPAGAKVIPNHMLPGFASGLNADEAAAAQAQRDQQATEDTMHQFGALTDDQYRAILQARLAAARQFSPEWADAMNKIQEIDDAATAAAEKAAADQAKIQKDQEDAAKQHAAELADAERKIAGEHMAIHDNEFRAGVMSAAQYREILNHRLEGLVEYSDEWYAIWQQIVKIDDDAAKAQEESAKKAEKAAQDAQDHQLEILRNEVDYGVVSKDVLIAQLQELQSHLEKYTDAWVQFQKEIDALLGSGGNPDIDPVTGMPSWMTPSAGNRPGDQAPGVKVADIAAPTSLGDLFDQMSTSPLSGQWHEGVHIHLTLPAGVDPRQFERGAREMGRAAAEELAVRVG